MSVCPFVPDLSLMDRPDHPCLVPQIGLREGLGAVVHREWYPETVALPHKKVPVGLQCRELLGHIP